MTLLVNEACSSVRTADKIKGMARKPCLFNFLPHRFQPLLKGQSDFSRKCLHRENLLKPLLARVQNYSRSFEAKLLFLICVRLRKSAARIPVNRARRK